MHGMFLSLRLRQRFISYQQLLEVSIMMAHRMIKTFWSYSYMKDALLHFQNSKSYESNPTKLRFLLGSKD